MAISSPENLAHASKSDDSDSDADSGSDSESDRRSRSRSRSRDKHTKHDKHGKDKQSKEKSKDKKHDKKKKHWDKHKDKSKKKKHKKDKEAAVPQEESLALTNRWGMYGVLNESDIFSKANEFNAWLSEVKSLSRGLLNRKEDKELFKEFAEDYNTATLPSLKYYDLESWEKEQRAAGVGRGDDEDEGLTDEDRVRKQRLRDMERHKNQAESDRVLAMLQNIKQAKETNHAVFGEMAARYKEQLTAKPTFESIAKQRQLDKEAKADAFRNRY